MKKLRSRHLLYLWLAILCIAYSSCSSGTQTLSPQLNQSATNTAILTPIPSQTITYTPTITPTSTLIPTLTPISPLEANWLTLPAPTISANNIDRIQFQTKLGLAGLTALSPDNKYIAVINRQRIALYNFKNLVEISLQPDITQF
jgi:hypothetical protein